MDFAYFNPNFPEEQPIINDGFSNTEVQGQRIPAAVLGVGYYCYKKKTSGSAGADGKAAAYTGTQYGAAYGAAAGGASRGLARDEGPGLEPDVLLQRGDA